jgi:adenosine deaminase CECR1
MSRVRDLEWPSRMSEGDWEAAAQDLPAKDEPFIKQYEMGRAALITQESYQRSGK